MFNGGIGEWFLHDKRVKNQEQKEFICEKEASFNVGEEEELHRQ